MNDDINPNTNPNNFGGFDDSDGQTFSGSGSSKNSSIGKSSMNSEQNQDKPFSGTINSEKKGGFISYINPESSTMSADNPAPKNSGNNWIKVIAAILLISGLIYFLIPDSPKNQPEIVIDTTEQTENNEGSNLELIEIDSQVVILRNTIIQDSIARVQDSITRAELAQGKPLDNNSSESISDNKPVIEEKIQEKPQSPKGKSDKSKKNKIVQKEVKVVEKKEDKAKNNRKADIIKQTFLDPATPLKEKITSKINTKTEEKVSPKSKDMTTLNKDLIVNKETKKSSVKAIYSVQVYATPSKDDANEALKKLKSRGQSSAYISMYKNRGTNFYRVRFGGFESRESAQSAAKKAGYNQAWIDRIE